jgi:hypothetical protein
MFCAEAASLDEDDVTADCMTAAVDQGIPRLCDAKELGESVAEAKG